MTVRGESLRRVVFHADDYGMNAAVNQGILQAFRDGLLTSTSLLANAPAAKEACQAWQTVLEDLAAGRLHSSEERRKVDVPHLPFDLGIHLNLTQGPFPARTTRRRYWMPRDIFPGSENCFLD